MTATPTRADEAIEILRSLHPLLTSINNRLGTIETSLQGVSERMARVEGQLTNIPSGTMIVLTIMGGLVANGLVIAGVVFAVLNFVKPAGAGG
jgi:hypothetical protein